MLVAGSPRRPGENAVITGGIGLLSQSESSNKTSYSQHGCKAPKVAHLSSPSTDAIWISNPNGNHVMIKVGLRSV